ncbi:TrkH family potassium uptake protein [Thermus thermamylovorans]|uniref:TrkH family potassium uptake protein n=1 Tax=Thermus thermamylovorans TaxID=2509362 RepID=A0A4Q9B9R3_9DEIN|nr:TrkH family potassium uptake protein [Thermus thermamylovorans]TBH21753.1 TrkH family potassium uptake protein [Thermus thermamylovorans]
MRPWPRSWAKLRPTLYLLGLAFQVLGLLQAAFGLLAWAFGENPRGFALGALAGVALGWLLGRLGGPEGRPGRAEVFLSVALLWLTLPLLGALPFWLSGGLFPLDALFESFSGYTATGATVLEDFAAFGPVLFIYRAFIQWLGGVGIVVAFLAVFPQLGFAGRQAFAAEVTGVEKETLTPRVRQTARLVLRAYLLLTTLAFLLYWAAGMPPYEALAHALTTASAAGFSPREESFAAYSPAVQWAATILMLAAGANFFLLYRGLLAREPLALLKDLEFRAYLGVFAAVGLGVAGLLLLHGVYAPLEALRHALFQTASLLTTTGYASADYAAWPVAAQVLLVLLFFVGGSAGSAAGGIKVVRWLILFAFLRREMVRTLHPQAVVPVRLGARVLSDEVLRQVSLFIFLYTLAFAFGAVAVGVLEGDFVVAFSASAQAIGNIGPGLGAVGPMASYADLHPLSKLVLILQMWAGRIELLPVVLLFSPELWRRLR